MDSSVRFFSQDIVTSISKKETVKNGRCFNPDSSKCGGFSAMNELEKKSKKQSNNKIKRFQKNKY